MRKQMKLKMFKFDIDIKTIFILVLGAAVILLLLFRPSKEISTYEEEMLILKNQNIKLLQNNDSLSTINDKLIEDVIILEEDVEEINIKLVDSSKEIDKLKKKKNEIPSNVIVMDANSVTNYLADYIKRRN
ncbi:MAG: hypothetical protein ACW980_21860 [Promethearchaeota archaeon]